jgi:hypothetical protein
MYVQEREKQKHFTYLISINAHNILKIIHIKAREKTM